MPRLKRIASNGSPKTKGIAGLVPRSGWLAGPTPLLPGATLLALPRFSLTDNIGWTAIAQGIGFVVSVGGGMMTARLLLPHDYAVMAMIAPVIGMAQIAQSLGLASAIINARTITRQQLDSVFGLVLTGSLLLGLLVAAAGPILAHWLTGRDLAREFAFLSLALPAAALALQPNALLARALRFRAIALRNLVANTCGIAVTVTLAWALHNHWALMVAPVLVPLINFALAASLVGWRPGLPGQGGELGSLLKFGLRVCTTNLLTFVSRNADNLIVAATSSAYQLGIYDRSYRVLLYPMTQAVMPLGQLVVPTLTRSREDQGLYRNQFWHAAGLLLMAAVPGLALMMVFPETIIGVLLGPAWLDGARLFAWFAAAAIAEIVLAQFNWLMMSQGRGRDVLRAGVVSAVAALSSFGIGAIWGILGIAIAFSLGRILVSLPFACWLAGREGPIGRMMLAQGFAPHICALAVTLTGLFIARAGLGTPLWPLLILICCAAYASYGIVVQKLRSSHLRNYLWSATIRTGTDLEAGVFDSPSCRPIGTNTLHSG